MKKIILFCSVFFILTTKGLTQDNNRKGFTSISFGVSIPTGNFHSNDFNNIHAGYARAGFVSDISLGYNILPKLGIIAVSRGQINGLDLDDYAFDLTNYFDSGKPSSNTSVSVESSAYSLSGLMAGIYGSFQIKNKLFFEPRILFGISTATLPAMTTKTYSSSTLLTTFVREQATSFAFAYMMGLGAKFNLSNRICLLFNTDFYSAKAKWENVQEIGIGHVTGKTEINYYNFKQNFGTFNISSGLGFRF